MILPIGHGEASTRRLPWVTFALMAACLASFLLTDTTELDAAPSRADRVEEAAHYWRQHAYLEVDRRIKEQVGYDVMPNQRSQYLATLPDLSDHLRPRDAQGLAEQQAELDGLTDLALGLVQPDAEAHNPYRRWGYVPASPQARGLLTHMFMHIGWFHLIGNLFVLLMAGPPVEDRFGRAAFAALFTLAGAGSALFYAILGPGADLPLVGASGAISGVLGAFLVRLWNTKIRFAYFFMFGLRIFTGTFEAAAWVMLPLWFGNELFQAVVWDSIGLISGVAYWAHVGGFLVGAAAALGLKHLRFEERFVDPGIEAKLTRFSANPVLEDAMAARERGEIGDALAMLQTEYERERDEDVGLALWDAALACAQPELGALGLAGAVSAAVKRGDVEVALRHWSDLSDHAPAVLVDPATLLRFVPMLLEESQRDRAVLAMRQVVALENTPLTPGQAMRAIDMARGLDPQSALRAARMALESGDLHEAKRAKLEALVAELGGQAALEVEPEGEPAALEEPVTPWDDDGAIRLSASAVPS
jgi:membrane associated rhomboid family serine protease